MAYHLSLEAVVTTSSSAPQQHYYNISHFLLRSMHNFNNKKFQQCSLCLGIMRGKQAFKKPLMQIIRKRYQQSLMSFSINGSTKRLMSGTNSSQCALNSLVREKIICLTRQILCQQQSVLIVSQTPFFFPPLQTCSVVSKRSLSQSRSNMKTCCGEGITAVCMHYSLPDKHYI